MKKNKRMLVGFIVTVLLFALFAYLLLLHLRMEKAVFMKHYYEVTVNKETDVSLAYPLPLSYMTNRNDDRIVVGLELLDHPDIYISASEHQESVDIWDAGNQMNTVGYSIGPYSIRHVNWEIEFIPEEKNLNETVLSDVRIVFDDSSELITTIGEIHLREQSSEGNALNHQYGSSSSDGQSISRFLVTEDITLSSNESPLLNRFKDRIDIKINEEPFADAVGKEFQEGDYITVSSELIPFEEELNEFVLFSLQPLMTFTHENGTNSEYTILNLNDMHPEYSVSNIYKFVNKRGVN